MPFTRRRRVKNAVVSKFLTAKDEHGAAQVALDSAYAELLLETKKVYNIFVPLKNAVSDTDWGSKTISKVKATKSGRVIEVKLQNKTDPRKESYWEFPAWMIGASVDRITDGIQDLLTEQGLQYKTSDIQTAESNMEVNHELYQTIS